MVLISERLRYTVYSVSVYRRRSDIHNTCFHRKIKRPLIWTCLLLVKMGKRGPKSKLFIARKVVISDFYKPAGQSESESIIRPIVRAVIDSVIASLPDNKHDKVKLHDGAKVTDKTIDQWKLSYKWLEIERVPEIRLKCAYCTEFKMNNTWTTDGTPNVQRSTVERHNVSKEHKTAEIMSLRKQCSSMETELEFEDEEVSKSDCNISADDMRLFRTVYTIAKKELPSDSVNDLLEMQALNGLDIKYKNLSWTTINDIQQCISTVIKRSLVTSINNSEYFALILDESTDITVEKRLSICIRYIENGEAVTQFLANVGIDDGRAVTVMNAVVDCLDKLGIDMSKCVSLATDGASVMMGRKTGVGVQIQSKYSPFIVQTHCFAHRLNLALMDSIKKNTTLKKFREHFSALYHFFSASSVRTTTLKTVQKLLAEPGLTVKEPHSVRWLGLKHAVHAVYESYESVLTTLSKFAQDGNATASGLHKYLSGYKAALIIALMLDIHTELGVLSCQLQKKNLLFTEIQPLMECTIGKLEHMKQNDGESLAKMKVTIEVKDEHAFYKGEELKGYGNEGKDAETKFESLRGKYLENIINNIHHRFRKTDSEVVTGLGTILEPATVNLSTTDECKTAVEALAKHYGTGKVVTLVEGDMIEGITTHETQVAPLVDEKEIAKEWPGLYGMMKGSYAKLSMDEVSNRIIVRHSDIFPNLAKLASIAKCITVTSVECERSFSTQNRIKVKYRASIGNEKLDTLLHISLCGPQLSLFDPKPACRLWLAKKRRKTRLMQEYKPRGKKSKNC